MADIEKQLRALSLDRDNFPRMREEKVSITVSQALEAADEIARLREALLRQGRQQFPIPSAAAKAALAEKIFTRLNNHLCEMQPGYDDSITGFNEAWEIISKTLRGE